MGARQLTDATALLATSAWVGDFDHNSLRRGAAYAEEGRVVDLEYGWVKRGAHLEISAAVAGTRRQPYHVTIEVFRDPTGVDVEGDCTCPVGYNCKHVAATLMVLGRDEALLPASPDLASSSSPEPQTPAWTRWLSRLQPNAATPAIESALEPGLQLAVVLDALDGVPSRLIARLTWVQPTKTGRLGKPEPLHEHQLHDDRYEALIDDAWRDRIGRLLTAPRSFGHGTESHILAGPRGEAWLQDCLDAGIPCFWQKPAKGQLRSADAHPALAWGWSLAADGSQQPTPDLPPGARLLKIHRLWLLQVTERLLSPLEAGTEDVELACALLEFPPLPPEQAQDLAQAWQQHPRLRTWPAPRVFPPAAASQAPPVPVLRLKQQSLDTSFAQEPGYVAYASLEYDYDGLRLPSPAQAGTVSRIHQDALHRIERQLAAEHTAEQQLDRAGLAPLEDRYDLDWRLLEACDSNDYLLKKPRKPPPAEEFLRRLSSLQAKGFRLDFDPSFPPALSASPPEGWYLDIGGESSGEDWFDLELGIELDGQRISLLPILQRALADNRLSLQPAPGEPADAVWCTPIDGQRHVALPLKQVRTPLLQWLDGSDVLRVPRVAAGLLNELDNGEHDRLRTRTSTALRALADQLRTGGGTKPLRPPKALKADLRPYQRDGLDWLGLLARNRLGGVLADDMGLGKTVQVLAHLLAEKQARRLAQPALIVAPTSVIGNWREQAQKFAPSLRLRVLHGSDRHGNFATLDDCDLAVTSYALLPRDREQLLAQPFSLAVFDEAQAIKNPRSQGAIVARALNAQRRLAVTGTPVENHLGELWSQFDCVLPGLLGDAKTFGRVFRTPIEKHGDQERQRRLHHRIAPFLLRRSKEQVARELPPKTEIVQTIELQGKQRALYETLRLAMHEKVQQTIRQRGLAQSSIVILDALLKLRQACCDPRLVKLDDARKLSDSAKLEAMLPMLDELLDEGRRVLLFSQFTGMLDLIEQALRQRKLDWLRLDGSTRDRDTPIRRFQAGECPLFLISLKAGGVGLNLTAADTVIHFDPWWNPAVERQATDRAHRIGQDKPVFVYKFICTGTVEEKIQALQRRKAELAGAVLDGGSRQGLKFDEGDIAELFAPLE